MSDTMRKAQFRYLMTGQASWFSAFGLQAVMFPYLVVNVLLEEPARIGIAQSALMLPSLLLLVLGGVVADACDLRKLLLVLHALSALPPLLLGLAVASYGLPFEALVAYAIAYGSIQAFILPARDAMLNRVAGDDMQRAVTTATAIQFASQIAGFLVGASARVLGAPVLLLVQAALLASGMLATRKLLPAPPIREIRADHQRESRWRQLVGGLVEVFGSPRIRPVVLLMSGVGMFFISVFMVLLPVMVRDFYAGSSGSLALINGAFVLGTISSTLFLMRRAPVLRQGRAMVIALLLGAVLVLCFSMRMPQSLFYALIYVFGIGAGVVMALGRTVVQESARASHRARIMAVYNLSFLGAAPVGAYTLGVLASATSVLDAALFSACGMFCLLALVSATTPVWGIAREAEAGR